MCFSMTGKMCGLHKVAWILLLVGGVNWGLVGAFNYNLVDSILGVGNWVSRLIYILVGLSALSMLAICKCCMKGMCGKK